MFSTSQLRVAVDVGCHDHRVAIGDGAGGILDEFDITHSAEGFRTFFQRIEALEARLGLPVAVAMEGYNGWARPLDSQVLLRGYRLFNVNNVKLARYKEIFPGAAKTDPIDARKMLELFQLKEHLPVAKDVLQEVAPVPLENVQLKRLTRRRRQLVNEKVGIINRLQSDLQAVCPGLLGMTRDVDNLWFLRFLTCREDLRQLARLHRRTLLGIRGVGRKYADIIQAWQKQAHFAEEVAWAGDMITEDASRILELLEKIKVLNQRITVLSDQSGLATRIGSMPGFGETTRAELAGEIGTLERFPRETSLALYLGMTNLDNSSGRTKGSKQAKQVNRRAKGAMMIAIARHMACVPESRAYYDKKRREGKSHNQAIRALGRHLVRVMWSMLKQDRDYELRTST